MPKEVEFEQQHLHYGLLATKLILLTTLTVFFLKNIFIFFFSQADNRHCLKDKKKIHVRTLSLFIQVKMCQKCRGVS